MNELETFFRISFHFQYNLNYEGGRGDGSLMFIARRSKILFSFSLSCLLCFIYNNMLAQKPAIAISDFKKWYFPCDPILSNNGKVASYLIYNKPQNGSTQIIVDLKDGRRKEMVNVSDCRFSTDSRFFYCLGDSQQLIILNLTSFTEDIVPLVKKYDEFTSGNDNFLVFLQNTDSAKLTIKGKMVRSYLNVYDYWISGDKSCFFINRRVDSTSFELEKINLLNHFSTIIYKGRSPYGVVVDRKGDQIVFCTDNESGKSFWYYNGKSMRSATAVSPVVKSDSGLVVSNLVNFGYGGDFVFCMLAKEKKSDGNADQPLTNFLGLKIFSYADPVLKSDSLAEGVGANGFVAVWYLKKDSIVQVQQKGEYMINTTDTSRFRLLYRELGHSGEWNWNESSIPTRAVLDLYDGSRKVFSGKNDRNTGYVLSPYGKWMVYFDVEAQSYFSYNLETGIRRNLTENARAKWTTYDNDDIPMAKYQIIDLAKFSPDGQTVYLYDQFDIYQVDLYGKYEPINLTNGIGRDSSIVFRFAFPPDNGVKGRILLTAFNRLTKEDGFYSVKKGNSRSLRKLIMQNAVFTGPQESKYFARVMPVKARDANVFLVERMDARNSPNVFATRDFVNFHPLSDIHPEKNFNWLTSELINFRTIEGKNCQGILYKPENFDPTKKYPVIFHYYEKMSECLNLFIRPDVCEGPINIPYFVSNGYLVFTPDIHFTIGYPGRSSYNTVIAAANFLSGFPYVDSSRMGLQGHSFGGFQTNYIITQTDKFAAACSAAGFTDFISAYGSIIKSGYSRQGQYELKRDRIGATLWERPDLYIENSPVLCINKIKTPLLIMHNMADNDVPVAQGIEFFTGLRRLGKVSYLLQYRRYGHVVFRDAAVDYTQKMMSFFDYYLRGGNLPSWMTDKRIQILSLKVDQ